MDMGNTDLIDKFYHLMLQVADEKELLYQQEREEAIKKNGVYSLYDKNAYLKVIEDWFKNKDYAELWWSYFSYIARKGIRIKDSNPYALEFFNRIIVPLIKSDALFPHPEYIKRLIAKLTDLGFYEEVLMINYFSFTKSYTDILRMTLTSSLFHISKEIDGFMDFASEHDPRR